MILHFFHAVYVLALVWYLYRYPADKNTPLEGNHADTADSRFVWIRVLVVSLVFILVVISPESGMDILLLFVLVSMIGVLIANWRGIRLLSVVQGATLGLVAFLAGLPANESGLISDAAFLLLAGLVPFLYVAGGLLIDRNHLGAIQLKGNGVGPPLKSFLSGCLLFVPLGLFNIADGLISGDLSWVSKWWMPITLPWFSGIAEEALFRLFLISICFFLLKPAFANRTQIAVVLTVLFSATVFGLVHGRELETFLTTGFLYGAPMAVVFIRRDWEHAVGAHYMINMPSWVVIFNGV